MRSARAVAGFALLLVLFGSACGSLVSLDDRPVALRIRGTVTAAAGSPVQEASIVLGRRVLATDAADEILAQTRTGIDGTFHLDPVIPCGPLSFLRVHATAAGYDPVYRSVSCSRAEQNLDLVLTPAVPP